MTLQTCLRGFRRISIVLSLLVVGACADATRANDPGGARLARMVDLGGGNSLLAVDFTDARALDVQLQLDPASYADYGITLGRALLLADDPTPELYPPRSRSAPRYVEPQYGTDLPGYRYPGGVRPYPIDIQFTNRAPGAVTGVRVYVGRTEWALESDPPVSMTCYAGATLVGRAETLAPIAGGREVPTYVPLEVRGQGITKCTIQPERAFIMDDLEVTFRSGITCTPAVVTRGAPVTCSLVGTNGAVARWEFEGDNAVNDPTLKISENTTASSWSGAAVESGNVRAVLTTGAVLTGRFDVQDRSSGWNWDGTKWSYSQGTAAICDDTEPTPGGTYGIGWNRTSGSPKNHCGIAIRHRRILPILNLQPNAGYTVASVASGPNRGRWYVTSASFHMARASNLNPSFLPGARTNRIRDTTHVRLCRAGMGLGPNQHVYANFYTFNELCMGRDVDSIIAAAWGHEGHGYNGGTGHEGLAWASASLVENNPYVVEMYTNSTESGLRQDVRTAVLRVSSEIESASRDPLPAGNWPGGDVWMWDGGQRKYVLTPLRAF